MAEIKYDITKYIGALTEGAGSMHKELNMVSWNDGDPKYDLRPWNGDHSRMGKGITLTEEELRGLKKLIDEELDELDHPGESEE